MSRMNRPTEHRLARGIIPVLFLGLLAACGSSDEPADREPPAAEIEGISLHHAWVRPAGPGMRMSAGYTTIVNESNFDDAIVGVSADFAEAAELHESRQVNGTSSMERVARLEVPAGRTVRLQPGGYHVMLINLTRELEEGDMYTVTFTFEDAGDVAVPMIAATGRTSDNTDH